MSYLDPRRSLVIDPAQLKDYAEICPRPPNQKVCALITTKYHPTLPLAIHNYTYEAFMRSKVDDMTVAARSLITESNSGQVISRSFPKFFNHHEKQAYKPTGDEHAFVIEEKVDGSIISLFYYNNEWMMASRSAFENQHTISARRILDKLYPNILATLDKSKTYVFELVDPRMPIRVIYQKEDLVLLAIFAKDGQEPPYNFDWSTFPFARPKIHNASEVSPKKLSQMNWRNEEGFVVKFWLTPGDRYPQRIKVKFESYLQLPPPAPVIKTSKTSHQTTFPPATYPPSNSGILQIYKDNRSKIHHFDAPAIAAKMDTLRQAYLASLQKIADDYGGEAWLIRVENVWKRIDVLFTLQEDDWRRILVILRREGYKPGQGRKSPKSFKQNFDRRILRSDIGSQFRAALVAWYVGDLPIKQVALVLQSIEIPVDLRSEDILDFTP
jgi:RNA ligase